MFFRNSRADEFLPTTFTGGSGKTGTLESFILRHPALRIFRPIISFIISFILPNLQEAPDPLECDLRHVFWRSVSDTPSGFDVPIDGYYVERLFYGTEILFQRSVPYVGGVPRGQVIKKGDPANLLLAELATAYQAVVHTVGKLVEERAVKSSEEVTISFLVYDKLIRHPLFLHLKRFWLERNVTIRHRYLTNRSERALITIERFARGGGHMEVRGVGERIPTRSSSGGNPAQGMKLAA